MATRSAITTKLLAPRNGQAAGQCPPAHHVGSPPTSFRNPWPSAQPIGFTKIFATRFFRSADKNNVPVPADREGLVKVRKPDWGVSAPDKLKATWIGHASFLVEASRLPGRTRGVRILLDPVFSERTSPVQWFGPKRYTPTPCTVDELPEVDVIVISHNHYDHCDSWTIQEVWRVSKERNRTPLVACALGNKPFFTALLPDLPPDDIVELDWWHGIQLDIEDVGSVELVCTPAQHTSARGPSDKDNTLWCSWIVREANTEGAAAKSLFFAGDTGYRHVDSANPTEEEQDSMPRCPAFKEIGDTYGPFDLALLPIGLYSPRDLMASVHCAPEDSVCIHEDIRSKKSIGMHYGTVRGGISAQYEDVIEPPVRWRTKGEEKGLRWNEDFGLCDIGETVLV